MRNSFFTQPKPEHHENNIMKDLLRLLRDLFAIANDALNLQVLSTVVDYLNQVIGDKQSNDTNLHP